jgi:hypothetical protein
VKRLAVVAVCALALAVGLAAGAPAAPGLVVGVSDDYLATEPRAAAGPFHDLGLDAVRLTIDWRPGMPALSGKDAAGIAAASIAAAGKHIVLAVYSDDADDAPTTPAARDEYCAFVRSIVAQFPQVDDVAIWNEPNKSTFWKPQFDGDASAAPGAYLQLLVRCYELLHAAKPSVNVIHAGLSSTGNDRPDARSNVSHSPGNFIRQEGMVYRTLYPDAARGPQAFDTLALHAYGESSRERPWEQHPASATIAMGDIDKLVLALWDAFAGTGQPVPEGGSRPARAARPAGESRLAAGSGGAGIWILENGYQTAIPAEKQGLYHDAENVPTVAPRAAVGGDDAVTPLTQATQVVDAIRIAYCNPYVTGYFNFLLRDDSDLGRWQSGFTWADWTPKPAYQAVKQIVAQVHSGTVDCSGLPASAIGPATAKTGVDVRRVVWPKTARFNWRNDLWRLRIQAAEPATYAGRVVRLGAAAAGKGTTVLESSGDLRTLYFVFVTFPHRRLAPGRYRMVVTLTSKESSARKTTLRGPVFTVSPRPR